MTNLRDEREKEKGGLDGVRFFPLFLSPLSLPQNFHLTAVDELIIIVGDNY